MTVSMGEAKKLYLIEEILKIENEALLAEVETVIARGKLHAVKRKSFTEFAGMMTDEEVNELDKAIAEGCETINADDWK